MYLVKPMFVLMIMSMFYADNEEAKVLLNDYSRGNIHKSTVHACDWSSVITDSNKVFCADAATVDITGGVVCDAGHREINAYKGTVVYSNLKKRYHFG